MIRRRSIRYNSQDRTKEDVFYILTLQKKEIIY